MFEQLVAPTAINNVVQVLQDNNRDIRGGSLVVGRREYRVRTVSRSQQLEQIEGFVLRRDTSGTVHLRDVAQVHMGRFVSILLLPPADYLPEGNRNLVLWAAEPFPGTSIPEAIRLSAAPREFLRQQPEVDRVMFIERPGRRGIATILKPEFATTQGLGDMVERMR